MKICFLFITIAVFVLRLTSNAQTSYDKDTSFEVLKVGDQAPLIKVAKWIKGSPIQKFNPGHVYVIEFGATWCGPCKDAIPHLSELAKKYREKARVISFFVWENRSSDSVSIEYISKVEKYIQKLGDKIAYSIAVDDAQQTMANTWLKAAKRNGIPTFFLVDQMGKIAFVGDGTEIKKLDNYLNKLIHGIFDATSVVKEQKNWTELYSQVNHLIKIGDYESALIKIDTLAKVYPDRKYLFKIRFDALRGIEEYKGYSYGWEVFNKALLVNNAYALLGISLSILTDNRYKNPDYDLAIALSKQIIKHDNRQDHKALAYKNISQAWFMKGSPDKGETIMQHAIQNLPRDEYYEKRKKRFHEELEKFRNQYKKLNWD